MQLCDHFATKEQVNECIVRTKLAFITHIHGDHQLGILKILSERDKLVNADSNPIYVITPSPMMDWMEEFVRNHLVHKNKVILIPSKYLNPEQCYYYQTYADNKYRDVESSELLDKED